jgi:Xaa-Pro aminopeptidase
MADYKLNEILKAINGDMIRAMAIRYQLMLADSGVTSGRLAVYGQIDAGQAFATFSMLQQIMPELSIVGETEDTLLLRAMATKEENEVARIQHMGQITVDVVGRVADFLTSHQTREDVLIKKDDTPLTIGEVKRSINLWLAELGAENPEGTIFAIGRDAGIPHSTGNDPDFIRLGQTIVFDIFPCEARGGYYYDLTRTWCLGYAPDEALKLYEEVLAVYRHIQNELRAGGACRDLQVLTCDLFEARGHPSVKSNPQTRTGYVHSLGHGVGLNVHEHPSFSMYIGQEDYLKPGTVFTIEPGLYYPEQGLGVRLEDTYHVHPDGWIKPLAEFPLDLVLPLQGSVRYSQPKKV